MSSVNDAIRLDCITSGTFFRCLSYSLPLGGKAAVYTAKQEESDLLVRLLLGFDRVDLGKVNVLGEDPATLAESRLYELRKKISVAHPDGGLISNLNVWDNLTLPQFYHSKEDASVTEQKGKDILNLIGYEGNLWELPGYLTTFRKRLVGIGRGMLTEPVLMIYNSVLDGLHEDEKDKIMSVTHSFHQSGMPERTSLFITSSPESFKSTDFDMIIRLKGGLLND